MRELEELKRDVFLRCVDLAGRAYVHVRYSKDVRLGRRGFVGDEKERGIVLVINSSMKFSWDEEGMSATLLFGTAPEKCFVPSEDIVAIYSPELGVQLMFTPVAEFGDGGNSGRRCEADGNVIKVNFTKGRQ